MNFFTPKDEELIRKIGWSYPLVIHLYEAYLEQLIIYGRMKSALIVTGIACCISLVWNILFLIKIGH